MQGLVDSQKGGADTGDVETPTPLLLGAPFPGEAVGNIGLPLPQRKHTPYPPLPRFISIFMRVGML